MAAPDGRHVARVGRDEHVGPAVLGDVAGPHRLAAPVVVGGWAVEDRVGHVGERARVVAEHAGEGRARHSRPAAPRDDEIVVAVAVEVGQSGRRRADRGEARRRGDVREGEERQVPRARRIGLALRALHVDAVRARGAHRGHEPVQGRPDVRRLRRGDLVVDARPRGRALEEHAVAGAEVGAREVDALAAEDGRERRGDAPERRRVRVLEVVAHDRIGEPRLAVEDVHRHDVGRVRRHHEPGGRRGLGPRHRVHRLEHAVQEEPHRARPEVAAADRHLEAAERGAEDRVDRLELRRWHACEGADARGALPRGALDDHVVHALGDRGGNAAREGRAVRRERDVVERHVAEEEARGASGRLGVHEVRGPHGHERAGAADRRHDSALHDHRLHRGEPRAPRRREAREVHAHLEPGRLRPRRRRDGVEGEDVRARRQRIGQCPPPHAGPRRDARHGCSVRRRQFAELRRTALEEEPPVERRPAARGDREAEQALGVGRARGFAARGVLPRGDGGRADRRGVATDRPAVGRCDADLPPADGVQDGAERRRATPRRRAHAVLGQERAPVGPKERDRRRRRVAARGPHGRRRGHPRPALEDVVVDVVLREVGREPRAARGDDALPRREAVAGCRGGVGDRDEEQPERSPHARLRGPASPPPSLYPPGPGPRRARLPACPANRRRSSSSTPPRS